jgi:hypothetical protein
VTMPFSTYPKIVHMKRHIAGTHTEHWLDELVWEYQDLRLRIQTVPQTGAFHYHVKDWQSMTPEELIKLFQAVPEPPPPFFRLYHDDRGSTLILQHGGCSWYIH